MASRSYVEDINLLSRGPTPAGACLPACVLAGSLSCLPACLPKHTQKYTKNNPGVLNELAQKKEVPPFFMDFEGEGKAGRQPCGPSFLYFDQPPPPPDTFGFRDRGGQSSGLTKHLAISITHIHTCVGVLWF